ncbi:MAG: thiamine-phosphate kinase [Gammaproteobacteria bacterium]
MSRSEFDVIRQYFTRPGTRKDVLLGVGDDAALLQVPPNTQLAVAVDTLIEGVHFPVQTSPADIAWKALAVNLSDLAAMGAEPAWFTLSLTMPTVDENWLANFSSGLFELAERFNIELVGGDTTRGSLSITIQVQGFVENALTRHAAKPGQLIMVSGTLGDAALALQHLNADQQVGDYLSQRLNRPEPRIALGQALAEVATAAIDISDGLLADLGHVLKASDCGATLEIEKLPCSKIFKSASVADPWSLLLKGGDDYELCFTVDENSHDEVQSIANQCGVTLTEIGRIQSESALRCVKADGSEFITGTVGYDHFR